MSVNYESTEPHKGFKEMNSKSTLLVALTGFLICSFSVSSACAALSAWQTLEDNGAKALKANDFPGAEAKFQAASEAASDDKELSRSLNDLGLAKNAAKKDEENLV